MFIKTEINTEGKIDYNGLNLNLVSPGTQLYPFESGLEDTYFYCEYQGTIDGLDRVYEISEEEYTHVIRTIENVPRPLTPEKRIEELEKTQGDLLMEIAMLKMGGSF